MAETTNISWCDATLNFWFGCTKVSTGPMGACEHCYAETWANRFPRYRGTWGAGAPRVRAMNTRAKAMALERLAVAKLKAGLGAFFCFSNSLGDIFDKEVPIDWLAEAFDDMRASPHVTYLLLTKRPQNIIKRAKAAGGLPPNAAIGCTAVTQIEADRDLPWLKGAKDRLGACMAFVSMEPLRELVDMAEHLAQGFLDWVICGFESGAHASPGHAFWARSLRDQCAAYGVPFEFKQWGEWLPGAQYTEACREADPDDSHSRFDCMDWNGEAFVEASSFWADGQSGDEVFRVGKKLAGRLLDGVEHNARPVVA